MTDDSDILRPHQRWAQFRFSVVGPLLAAPPKRGELQHLLDELAAKHWRHPISGQWMRFGRSTIERWYDAARNEAKDPVRVLQRKVRSDCGQHPACERPSCAKSSSPSIGSTPAGVTSCTSTT